MRRIAVVNALRCLSAKILGNRVQETLGEKFRHLSYGTRGGAEAGVDAAREYVQIHFLGQAESQKVVVKLDFNNAFSMLRRQAALSSVLEHVPE